ncbi:MAG: hypothetical protein JOZ99_03910 [Actinobacteria bacterium]|nr:hypothetical protein [Actinomycetota bacterium]
MLIVANRSMNGLAAAEATAVANTAVVVIATSADTLRLLAVGIVSTAPFGAHLRTTLMRGGTFPSK